MIGVGHYINGGFIREPDPAGWNIPQRKLEVLERHQTKWRIFNWYIWYIWYIDGNFGISRILGISKYRVKLHWRWIFISRCSMVQSESIWPGWSFYRRGIWREEICVVMCSNRCYIHQHSLVRSSCRSFCCFPCSKANWEEGKPKCLFFP